MKSNTITIVKNSSLKGKELVVNYRLTDRFIITEELIGNRVIVLCNNGCEYTFDLSDDVKVIY